MTTTSQAIPTPSETPGKLPWWATRPARSVSALITDPFLSRGAFSVFDQGVVSATSLLTTLVIARACSPQALGVFYLALTMALLVRSVQEQVVSAPYMIYCNRYRDEALASYAGSTLAHQLAISGLSVIGLAVLAGILTLGVGPADLAPAICVLLAVLPCMLLREYIRQLAFAHLQPAAATAIDVTVAVLQLGGLLLLAWGKMLGVVAIYGVMGGSCAIGCAGWFLFRKQSLRLVPSRFVADWCHNWSFGKWALAGQLLGSATLYVLPWVLALVHGTEATGVLAACVTLVGVSQMFMTGVSNYLTPKAAQAFAQGGVGELQGVLKKTALLFVVTLGGMSLLLATTGEWLAVIVYGTPYAGCGPTIAVLGFGVFIGSIGMTAGNGLWAMERPSASFGADVCALLAMLAVAACLVQPLGVFGAAIATLSGTTVGAVVRCITLLRSMESIGCELAET